MGFKVKETSNNNKNQNIPLPAPKSQNNFDNIPINELFEKEFSKGKNNDYYEQNSTT